MGRLSRTPALVGLAVVLLVGVVVRLPGLGDPPLDFHPARQYHGLNNARRIYLDWTPEASARDREVARLTWARSAQLEPPILEAMTAVGYRVTGGERPWLGRLLSMLAWTVGTVALFALARRLFLDDLAAVVAAAVMFLLPYTVPASTSFQPDPLSVALTVVALWLVIRWDDEPSTRRLVAAGMVGGVAALVKAVAAPYVGAVFLAVLVARHRRRALAQRSLYAFAAMALAPSALFYAAGVVTGTDLGAHAGETFIPSLLKTAAFWRGWAQQVQNVTTIVLALVALLAGIVLAPNRRARYVLAAGWSAYVVAGVVLTFHTSTHDYYQLPVLPLVGLGAGLAFSRVPVGRRVLAGAVVGALVLAAVFGVSRSPGAQQAAFVAECTHIGAVVGHSGHVIYLAEAYGAPLSYYGRISGVAWPATFDLLVLPPMPFDRRWRRSSQAVGGAQWFIVTDLGQLGRQPDLERRLRRYRLAADEPSYRIYDLRSQA